MDRNLLKEEIKRGRVHFDKNADTRYFYTKGEESEIMFPIPVTDSMYLSAKREIEIDKIINE
tara:strand:- start:7145 stop:7330 length:186 start_codon:yes stop_codon:yes gene_type:complete